MPGRASARGARSPGDPRAHFRLQAECLRRWRERLLEGSVGTRRAAVTSSEPSPRICALVGWEAEPVVLVSTLVRATDEPGDE